MLSKKLSKRDIKRIETRKHRELLKAKLMKALNPIAYKEKEEKSRVSCNLNSKLADALLVYVKNDNVPFTSRTSLIEYIVTEWSIENNILES